MKNQKIRVGFLVALLATQPQTLEAGTVRVINENDCMLSMTIIPENIVTSIPFCRKNIPGTLECPGKNFGTFTILPEYLEGAEEFAIEGLSGSVVFGGTCRCLSVFKDYQIVFHNGFLGTSCEAQEIDPLTFVVP